MKGEILAYNSPECGWACSLHDRHVFLHSGRLMKRIWIPQTVASIMLLWALEPGQPYGYYILLRWVCCGVFAYLAVQAYKQGLEDWVWVLGITAAVYNPIFRIHLTREIWSVVNIVTIGIALASINKLKSKDTPSDNV